MDIGRKLQQLENRLAAIERSARLSHASLDNAALQVKDGTGSLRAILGVQADGTTAVNIVNGPPPPAPSAPIVASVLGGVTVSWDGQFADGSVLPLDWARVEVHTSTSSSYTPTADTLKATIETAQGATVVVATQDPVYVQMVARNTSGAASPPSATVGPFGPTPVVASDVLDGIITTVKLADDAVTAAKVAVNAIDAAAIQDAAVTATKIGQDAVTSTAIADGAVGNTQISDGAITTPKLTANAVTANELSANAVTAGKIATGAVIAGKLDAGAVTAGTVAASAVQAGNLAANAVQAGNIAADAVQAGTIAANAVTAREINTLAVTSDKLAANSVIAGKIAAGAVTATSLTVGIGDSLSQKITDPMSDATLWATAADAGTWSVVTGVTDAIAGSTVIQANGRTSIERVTNTPFDVDTLYRITARVRTTANPTSGTPTVYIGVTGVAADGTTRVNTTGANSISNQHYVAAANQTVAVGTAWTTVTGYIKGTAATGTVVAAPDPKAPGQMYTSVRYIRPLVRLLVGSTAGGTMQVDQVTLETVSTGVVNNVNIADGAITANKIQAGAVDATAIAADAITGKTITGGTVTGALIQTASSGERITLNESGNNKLFIYDSTNSVVASLTPGGASLTGPDGNIIAISPAVQISGSASTYPAVRWVDPTQTKAAMILSPTNATGGLDLQLQNSAGSILFIRDGLSDFTSSRLRVFAPASTNAVLYLEADPAHTGPLLRATVAGTDKFLVDTAGNTSVSGRVKPISGETANLNLQAGWTNFDATNYGTAQVRKTAQGQAYLIGRLNAGTLTNGTTIATLPGGYWPTVRHTFPYRVPQANAGATIIVYETGELRIWDTWGTITNVSLSGMIWPTF